MKNQRIHKLRNTETKGWVSQDTKGRQKIAAGQEQSPDQEWQIRIPVALTRENIAKAATALAKLRFDSTDFPGFKLIMPGANFDSTTWSGMHSSTGSDRDQRGKELNIFIPKWNSDQSEFSKEQYAGFIAGMLGAFDKASVELDFSRVCTPIDERSILCDDPSITLPIFYSAFKPWQGEHGILLAQSYNPENHTDPLEGMKVTRSDLERGGVDLNKYSPDATAAYISQQKQGLNAAKDTWLADYQALIAEAEKADESESYRTDKTKWPRQRDSDSNPIRDAASLNTIYEASRQEFFSLAGDCEHSFPENAHVFTEDQITKNFQCNPYKMQCLFRRFHHMKREEQAIESYSHILLHIDSYISMRRDESRGDTNHRIRGLFSFNCGQKVQAATSLRAYISNPNAGTLDELKTHLTTLKNGRLSHIFKTYVKQSIAENEIVKSCCQSDTSSWLEHASNQVNSAQATLLM